MKVLFIDKLVPYPPADGGTLRVFNLLRYISQHCDVSLLTWHRPSEDEAGVADYLKSFCAHVEFVGKPVLTAREYRQRQFGGLLRCETVRSAVDYSERMASRIRTLTTNEGYDVVDIQRPEMAPYVKAISPNSHCRKILTLYDVPYVQYRRMMAVKPGWRAKLKFFFKDVLFLKRMTLKYGRYFDQYIMVSELDRRIIVQDNPDLNVVVIPNGVNTQDYTILREQQPISPTLILVGKMNYLPNVDGAVFFCQEILPLIRQQVPDCKLLIVGQKPDTAVRALASDYVFVTGYVESVVPYYQDALVSVVPLRSGGGTRLKILESMALGRPVVSTTLGCEGLAVAHEKDILVADTPADFAAQTVRLLNDEALRQRLIVNGRRLVELEYDWRPIAKKLLQVYRQ
ncbi:MAG: glycosyltransferase [Anaerolineae bacterium]|nr:glycosyltransferase [Anaerolineae bacterium]